MAGLYDWFSSTLNADQSSASTQLPQPISDSPSGGSMNFNGLSPQMIAMLMPALTGANQGQSPNQGSPMRPSSFPVQTGNPMQPDFSEMPMGNMSANPTLRSQLIMQMIRNGALGVPSAGGIY